MTTPAWCAMGLHDLDQPENVYWELHGRRCRPCQKERALARHHDMTPSERRAWQTAHNRRRRINRTLDRLGGM